MRGLALGLVVVTILLASVSARAGVAAQDLDAVETAYAELDYARANKLAVTLSQQRGLTHDQLVRVYRMLARTHAVLDHTKEASDAFKALLAYNPDEKQDAAQPPKVQEAYSTARGFWAGYTSRPGIEVQTSLHGRAGGFLRVTTRDPTHLVKKVVIGYRWGGTDNFTTTNIGIGDAVSVDVTTPPPNLTRLDYYAQAFDDRDDAVFEVGSAVAAKTTYAEETGVSSVPEKPGTTSGSSVLSNPLFWIVAGGVALAGAGAGVFFATRKGDPTSANYAPSFYCAGTTDGRCH